MAGTKPVTGNRPLRLDHLYAGYTLAYSKPMQGKLWLNPSPFKVHSSLFQAFARYTLAYSKPMQGTLWLIQSLCKVHSSLFQS